MSRISRTGQMSGMRQNGAMKAAQAVQILALEAEDDFEAVKKKYRKLMGRFHPAGPFIISRHLSAAAPMEPMGNI